jgi:hypothetical protein
MIFSNLFFANNRDLFSQIIYVICLTNLKHVNIVHWSSIKCKRVIRSVLATEKLWTHCWICQIIKLKMQSTKKKMIEKHDFEITRTFLCYQKDNWHWHFKWYQTKNCKKNNNDNNDKNFNNDKTTENDTSNVKFVNMTNLKLFKYASMFIKKTFNNLLWRSVIFDSDCNDSLIYDLNWFVNEMTFAHEIIDTSNDFMLIEEYEIMFVIVRINEKNRRMFFDNIVYVSFIDVILMFVARFKKQDFIWNMYKKTLMMKSIDVMICDIKKKHDLFFLKYRFVEKFVNAVQSHKKILTKTILWNWYLRLKHCRSKMINQLKKIDEIEIIQKHASKIVYCDTCAISKMHRLIQRTSSAKMIKLFQILHFDLIICNKTFNKTTCIAHFIDQLIFFNWVYSLIDHKKKTLLSIFRDLINQCDRIKFNKRAIIRIIHIDQKIFIDKKLENWMRAQEINWNWSTKNIFEQNEKFERFDELLIKKTKCIKEHVKLSKDFYSKCYFVVTHILNWTSSSTLSWDSLLIFMRKLLKKSIRNEIAHFKMFDCKTFSFFKEINALKKNEKMKSRAFIEYLINMTSSIFFEFEIQKKTT